MLTLHNLRMELSNVRKKEKKRELTNLTKKLSNMMLRLHNIRMELLNCLRKNVITWLSCSFYR